MPSVSHLGFLLMRNSKRQWLTLGIFTTTVSQLPTTNRTVFKCLLKVSSVTSLDRSATSKLFHVTGPLTAKLLSPLPPKYSLLLTGWTRLPTYEWCHHVTHIWCSTTSLFVGITGANNDCIRRARYQRAGGHVETDAEQWSIQDEERRPRVLYERHRWVASSTVQFSSVSTSLRRLNSDVCFWRDPRWNSAVSLTCWTHVAPKVGNIPFKVS